MKKYAMIHDENLCIGCDACMVACKNENKTNRGVNLLKIHQQTIGVFPNLQTTFRRTSCIMCEDSACEHSCPVGAIFHQKDGVVLIDDKKCIGCGYCLSACPYGGMMLDTKTAKATKYTFCFDDKLSANLSPACVAVCPTDALIFGDLNDKNSEISKYKKSVKFARGYKKSKPRLGIIKNSTGNNFVS